MYQTILVPLDGSPASEQALPAAARLARAAGARLHIVHVHTPYAADPITIEGLPVIDDELRSLAADHERAYLERAATGVAGDGLRPEVARLSGPAVATLCEYAQAIDADLIALTSHGRSGFERLWLGSVAEALIRTSELPLLLLRPGAGATTPFRRILVPLDGSDLAERILPAARTLAELEGAEIELLRVIDTLPVPEHMPYAERFRPDAAVLAEAHARAEEHLERIAEELRATGAAVRVRLSEADQPARAIIAAGQAGADLIALATHGRSGLAQTLLGGVADKVVRASQLPLLIIRPVAEE